MPGLRHSLSALDRESLMSTLEWTGVEHESACERNTDTEHYRASLPSSEANKDGAEELKFLV